MRCLWRSRFALVDWQPGETVTSSRVMRAAHRLVEVLLEPDVTRRQDPDGDLSFRNGHA